MEYKVVLVLVDGMRPDGFLQCGSPRVADIVADATVSFTAQTVMPSVTLPCHMSLFHSVPPQRHGILSNTYVPMPGEITGLVEAARACGKKTAFFITWEELRDLSHPDALSYSHFRNQHHDHGTDTKITTDFLSYLAEEKPDFTFLYLGETDEVGGHSCGWMSETYEKTVAIAANNIGRVKDALPEDYVMIVIADHGGHDRAHGSDLPEDMTIPVICYGGPFAKGAKLPEGVSILDIAPTVMELLGGKPDAQWEGKSLL